MKKNTLSKRIVSLTVLMALAMGGNASADRKTYSHAACTGMTVTDRNAMVLNYTGVENASTTAALKLRCPAINDNINITSAWITVFDQHTTENVTCALYTTAPTANGWAGWGESKSTTGYSSDPKTLTYGAQSGWASDRAYAFDCSVPKIGVGKSRVSNYSIVESQTESALTEVGGLTL